MVAYNPSALQLPLAVRGSGALNTGMLVKATASLAQCCYPSTSPLGRQNTEYRGRLTKAPNLQGGRLSRRRIEVGASLAGDHWGVLDGRNLSCTRRCQQGHGFEPGITTGAPAFRY